MEQFLINADQLNYNRVKELAAQKGLKQRVKSNETFYIPTPQKAEVEGWLTGESIGFTTKPHPTYNLTIFTIK